MVVEIDGKNYEVIITRKKNLKNMYLRVKEDGRIYVNCHILVTNSMILRFIKANEKNIIKSYERIVKRKDKEDKFYYLGKEYDIVYLNSEGLTLGEDKVFINPTFNLSKWYQKMASKVFQEELDLMYQKFQYAIPYPSLRIRKMKTRWGVCNVKTHKVTLNLELIKKDLIYLDYVIVHELSHLLYPNHSKEFWQCVERNFPNYKIVRKELKSDE